MRRFAFVMILTLVSAQSFARSDEWIFGGTEPEASDPVTKSTVGIRPADSAGERLCTGSIIAPHVVVTAAHCLRLGETLEIAFTNDATDPTSARARVTKKKGHPDFDLTDNIETAVNDIALLVFEGEAPANYAPVKLASRKRVLKEGTKIVLAGYGVDRPNGHEGAGTLRRTEVEILKPDFSPTTITVNQRNGTGACFGDSGGPAFVKTKGGALRLVGLTSGGNDCADFGIYTKVAAYLEWIKSTSAELLAPN
jgi:secreted trypsin-like serine protease